MIVGVTGTRSGMTQYQIAQVEKYFDINHDTIIGIRHGDCAGVDVQFANMANLKGYITYQHPPRSNELRAFHKSDIISLPRGYFERNRDIVNGSEVLIVIPWQMEHSDNGGTWYTHDYAIKTKKPVLIFWPEERL